MLILEEEKNILKERDLLLLSLIKKMMRMKIIIIMMKIKDLINLIKEILITFRKKKKKKLKRMKKIVKVIVGKGTKEQITQKIK